MNPILNGLLLGVGFSIGSILVDRALKLLVTCWKLSRSSSPLNARPRNPDDNR